MPTLAPLGHPRLASQCAFSVPTQHRDTLPEMSSGVWWCLIDPTEPPKRALKQCQRRLQGGETPPMGTRTRRFLLKPPRAEFLPLKMCFAHLQPRQPPRPPRGTAPGPRQLCAPRQPLKHRRGSAPRQGGRGRLGGFPAPRAGNAWPEVPRDEGAAFTGPGSAKKPLCHGGDS